MYSVVLAIALPIWQPFWQQEIPIFGKFGNRTGGGMLAKTIAKKRKVEV